MRGETNMGEIADDLVSGFCCADCGTYFKQEHSYPVLCDYCWAEAKRDGRLPQGETMTIDHKQEHIYDEL